MLLQDSSQFPISDCKAQSTVPCSLLQGTVYSIFQLILLHNIEYFAVNCKAQSTVHRSLLQDTFCSLLQLILSQSTVSYNLLQDTVYST